MLSLEWFNERINYYAKLLGIQKIKKHYVDGRTLKLVTCMALREAGERHHDNAGGEQKAFSRCFWSFDGCEPLFKGNDLVGFTSIKEMR